MPASTAAGSTLQATVTVKFQHCSFSEEFATAMAAYDSAAATAWVAPFSSVQHAYWARQLVGWLPQSLLDAGATLAGTHVFNKVAGDLASQRQTAIFNAATSAYATCISGGATAPTAPVPTEPAFKLVVQTKLTGASALASGGAAFASAGVSAQLGIPFAPANPALADSPLDWRPFYRIGAIVSRANDPSGWTLTFNGSDPYGQGVYFTTPMRTGVKVSPGWLTEIGAQFSQCIPHPAGHTVATPDNLAVPFQLVGTAFSFIVSRYVLMPDGSLVHDDYAIQSVGQLSGSGYDATFPAFSSDCEESGMVRVRYMIQQFSIHAEYTANSDIQKLRDNAGAVYDFPAFVHSQGSLSQMIGDFPDAYCYLEESFNYLVFKLGIVRVKYYDAGVFQYQKMFLVWAGAPLNQELLVGLTSNAASAKFYDQYLTQTTAAFEPIQVFPVSGGSATINTTLNVPVVEDVTVDNINSGDLTVGASAYVSYSNSLIKVHNTLKPLDVFTPYGNFVDAQPRYQATGNFLSVLPDFVDYDNWVSALGLARAKFYTADGTLYNVQLFLVWTGTPRSKSGYTLSLDPSVALSLSQKASASRFSVKVDSGHGYTLQTINVVENVSCTRRVQAITVPVMDSWFYWADPANPSTGILQFPANEHPGVPGYVQATKPDGWGTITYTTRTFDSEDFSVSGGGTHLLPLSYSNEGFSYTILKVHGAVASRGVGASTVACCFCDTSKASYNHFVSDQPTNVNAYEPFQVVEDFMLTQFFPPDVSSYLYPHSDTMPNWPGI